MSLIGSTPDRSGPLLSLGLARFQAILAPSDFETIAQRAGCTPKKDRPLTPQVVFWLMACVGLHTESMTQGLLRAWDWVRAACPHLPSDCVSEEAFCQARKQLPLHFWRALWDRLQARYQQRFAAAMRWKGVFRVLAGDGSEVRLPKAAALVAFFGCPKNGKRKSRQPQGRLVAFCSVFTGFCVAFKFVPLRFSEHTVLRHLIPKLKINDLLLLDRGFFSLRRHLAHRAAAGPLPSARLEPNRTIAQADPTPRAGGMGGALPPFDLRPAQQPRPARRVDLSAHSVPASWIPSQLAADFADGYRLVFPGRSD